MINLKTIFLRIFLSRGIQCNSLEGEHVYWTIPFLSWIPVVTWLLACSWKDQHSQEAGWPRLHEHPAGGWPHQIHLPWLRRPEGGWRHRLQVCDVLVFALVQLNYSYSWVQCVIAAGDNDQGCLITSTCAAAYRNHERNINHADFIAPWISILNVQLLILN